jgi:hypothetical protein
MFARLGMSEYYGSEGLDRPPSDVYSCFVAASSSTRVATYGTNEGGYEGGSFVRSAMTGLGRLSALARGACNDYQFFFPFLRVRRKKE